MLVGKLSFASRNFSAGWSKSGGWSRCDLWEETDRPRATHDATSIKVCGEIYLTWK
jgi:hypothetical protein